MSKYDDLFESTAPTDSVFTDKGALDPLAAPDEIIARDTQERRIATILNGVQDGYLPTTVSVYGPPGTGKTLTTRRVCREFAVRHDELAVEYVNLKECRTLFSAANEICFELTGEKRGAYEGLDGVFEAIWNALSSYPEWTVLILDEIDHVRHDANYDPNEFFYRFLRGEGKLKRDIQLSVWLISNELLDVDLRLDSRVQSAMSGETVFFPPYGRAELTAILTPRVEAAFRDDALSEDVLADGVREAAQRWGDVRKALTLFRHAGETATERDLAAITEACLTANLETTEKADTLAKLEQLPLNHLVVLTAAVAHRDRRGRIVQPVSVTQIHETLVTTADESFHFGTRTIREIVAALETMGRVETWIDSRGREGRVKQIRTTFDPRWVRAAQAAATLTLAD